MVSAKTFTEPDAARIRTCSRARELEDYSVESTASTFPNKSAELFLWHNANPVWQLHAVGVGRSGAWSFFVRLCRHAGSVCSTYYAREKLSSHDRVLDMGRRVCDDSSAFDSARPYGLRRYSDRAEFDRTHSESECWPEYTYK